MDWRSKEGRALLWAAYPDGVLAMRGVMSIGPTPAWGWLCVAPWSHSGGSDTSKPPEVDPWAKSSWCRVGEDGSDYPQTLFRSGADNGSGLQAPHSGGLLLPMPDPADVATWACLQLDLARTSSRLARAREAMNQPLVGFYWFRVESAEPGSCPPGMGHWCLNIYDAGGYCTEDFYLPETVTDPAEALVRAKIHALECRAKEP